MEDHQRKKAKELVEEILRDIQKMTDRANNL